MLHTDGQDCSFSESGDEVRPGQYLLLEIELQVSLPG